MTFVAAGLGVEKFPAALSRSIDRVLVAGDEAIERRIEGHQRAFVGCDRAHEILAIDWPAKHAAECPLIFIDRRKARDRGVQIRLAHLDWVDDRERGLILERLCPAIPELCFVVESVQNGRRISLSNLTADTYRRWLSVGECAIWIVATGASDAPIRG